MAYPSETIARAEMLFVDLGFSCREIAKEMELGNSTVWEWYRKGGWQKKKNLRGSAAPTKNLLLTQITQLAEGAITDAVAKRIAHLSKALAVLDNLEKKKQRKDVKKPAVRVEGNIDDKFREYEEKHLRKYQRDFVQDDSRFRCMLKARQVGMSWTESYDMLKNGMLRKTDQNLVSTSLGQAENTVRYCRQHLKALGIKEVGKGQKQEIVLPVEGDVRIRTLPANQATSQGWPGDVIFDEMAWYRRPKEVWTAIVPSVTAVSGRITCLSTPYEAGPHNHFWSVATNDGDQFGLFSRHSIDIYSAIEQGLSINVEELRQLFDADTFDRLYHSLQLSFSDTLNILNNQSGFRRFNIMRILKPLSENFFMIPEKFNCNFKRLSCQTVHNIPFCVPGDAFLCSPERRITGHVITPFRQNQRILSSRLSPFQVQLQWEGIFFCMPMLTTR